MTHFKQSMYDLVVRTSTRLPADVRQVLAHGLAKERAGSQSAQALSVIANNIGLADEREGPICQDTGWLTFNVKIPVGVNQIKLRQQILEAVAEATAKGKLRPNSVDSLTGKNSGNNLGPGSPTIHFEEWEKQDEMEVRLLLKGGGCENMNIQYSLPTELPHLGRADRTLDGVRKCVLHAVWQAQGQGCSPGIVGVCIGGDRTDGYAHAKEQLFRPLDDTNAVAELAALEDYIMKAANTLGIGAMGFGGETTLLGCKVGAQNRLPACFFLSVAYDCWAFRRLGAILDARNGAIKWSTSPTREKYSSTGRSLTIKVPSPPG